MLKKIKSIFVVEDERAGNTSASESGQQTNAGTVRTPAEVVYSGEGQVSDMFLEVLKQALLDADLEGFDYMEFKQFLRSLDQVKMDEATKFRSAYATGQTMGATVQNLVSSGRHYLEVLKKEEQRFKDAVNNRRTRIIDERELGIQQIEKEIDAKEEQIKNLKAEIEKAREEIKRHKEEVTAERTKIDQTKNDFFETYNVLVREIQDDLKKIQSYLSS